MNVHTHVQTDQSYQVLQDPSYNDMRAEAALHAKMRAENFQKAAHARTKKQFEVASYYAQLVSKGVWRNACVWFSLKWVSKEVWLDSALPSPILAQKLLVVGIIC